MAITKSKIITEDFGYGLVIEHGIMTFSGGTTADNLVARAPGAVDGTPGIVQILWYGFASNGDNAVDADHSVAPNTLTLTHTSADVCNYFLVGKAY